MQPVPQKKPTPYWQASAHLGMNYLLRHQAPVLVGHLPHLQTPSLKAASKLAPKQPKGALKPPKAFKPGQLPVPGANLGQVQSPLPQEPVNQVQSFPTQLPNPTSPAVPALPKPLGQQGLPNLMNAGQGLAAKEPTPLGLNLSKKFNLPTLPQI
jgi:hypothetical protein